MDSDFKPQFSQAKNTPQVQSVDWMTYVFVIICLIMVLIAGISLWGGM